MKIFASFLSRLFFFTVLCELFQLILSQVGAQNKAVFQVLTEPQEFLKTSDIITFKPSAYTGSPWNFTMSDLLDSGDFKKSVGFWVRHNMTSPPSSAITLVRGASTLSKTPVIATDAHFLVYLEASGNNTQIKLRYLVSGSTVVKQTLVSNITPYNWYGVFVSRSSTSTDDRGILFVYDPSTIVGNNYNSDLQSVIAAPLGYQKAAATSKFYIDIGGDSQTAIACNCDITNFNFLYKQDYFENATDILELIKQPPNLRLWLQYEELDDTLELTADDSNSSNVVFRGDSQFDTNRDTQLNYDLTANGEVGHVYSQSGFDTIYPAFDLGREFTITFWLQFATRPSSVTNDTFQPVFFAQNSQYPQMKVYVAFETTVDSVTGIYVQSGMYGFTETLAQPIPRSNSSWYYFSVSYANFYKNESAVDFTFNPTTLYTVRYILADGTMATPITGILNDSYIYGGTTDIMRIGMGVDGNNENLFATIKKLQIFSGSWAFDVVNDTCLHAIGGDKVTHITQGILSSHTYCQTCTTGYNLTDDDCMGNCPNGFYSVNDTNFYHCENCYENCLTCTGRKSEQCLSCTFGAWMPFDTITCPAINPCNSHQFDQNSVCVECLDQCATCKSQSTCSACAQGFSYNLNTFACEIQICGDGVVDTGEQCDDGNQVNGDGCSSTCKIEVGWYCNFAGGACYSICGDNLLASNEGCDDGNNHNGDGCSYNCTVEPTYFCSQGPSGIGPFTDISYKENCTVCDLECSVCATATTCSKCQTGKFLYNGRCQDNCTQSGLYQDTASLSCKTCPNLCAECTNATFCTSCTGSAALYNNKCYSTCPNGMYNGLDTVGVRRCLTCPSNCVTCSSATSCYTCNTGYFLNSSGSCAACNETCKTCRGPAATDCVLCAPGLTLQKNTSTCIVLSCQSNQFTNYDLGQCQDCDPSCATCSSTLSTGCLTCNAGEALTLTNQCLACTAANGLSLAADGTCVEICGDGKRVTSSKQCDDGNLVNGDGCSSTCTIESGWSCSGGNETSPDTCISIVGPTPIITVNPDDPTSFQISFNKEIINTLQEKDYLAQIIVALEGVPAENSDYNIFYNPHNQSFTVVFGLTQSVLDSMLTVQFKDPSRITDLSQNPVAPAITMVAYPTYYYVDPETINAANGLSTFSIVIQSINTVTIIPLALTGYLAHYWMFLEYFQIVNYLTYMNVRTPYIVNEFFKSFRYLQLSWLPNAPKGADMNYDRASQLGDYKFAYTNTLFLENAGYQLTTWAFLIALWMVLKAIIRVGFKKSILKYLIYHVMLNLEWSIILRAVIETFFAFCLFTYLQLSNFSTSGAVVTASSLLSIVALLFTLAFPIFCFLKTTKIRNLYLLDLETEYDTLYREFRKKRSTTTGFITLTLFQKVLIAAILVGLQASIETQIAIFAIEQIVMLLILIVMRPYVDGSMNFRAVVQELILFAVVTLFYGLLDENTDENVRNNVGKVMVGLLIVALLMHCAFLIKDSYHAIKEHIQTPENSRKIFGKVRISPNGQDEFRISRGSGFGSSGRLGVPGSEANLISNNPNAETIGDTMLGEELSKPSGTKIRDGSLFGDNETVQIAPSQNSLAGEGDNLMGGTVPSRPSLELREPKKLNRIPWRP